MLHSLFPVQIVAMRYTFGDELVYDPYHVPVIRTTLNRNLGVCFPDIQDEIVHAFDDILALKGNGRLRVFAAMDISSYSPTEWKSIPAMDAMLRIVCRASNRLFVGLPLCEVICGYTTVLLIAIHRPRSRLS
jgi:hypothetical protein